MSRNKRKENITRNCFCHFDSRQFLVFLFFLFVSFLFWVFQSFNHTCEIEVNVPLKVEMKNATLQQDKLPKSVELKLQGRGFELLQYKYTKRGSEVCISLPQPSNDCGEMVLYSKDLTKEFGKFLPNDISIKKAIPDSITINYTLCD